MPGAVARRSPWSLRSPPAADSGSWRPGHSPCRCVLSHGLRRCLASPTRDGRRARPGVRSKPMAVETGLDVALLKSEIRKTYASVSQQPGKDFIFPTGRAWAEDLDYP